MCSVGIREVLAVLVLMLVDRVEQVRAVLQRLYVSAMCETQMGQGREQARVEVEGGG